MSTIIEFPKSGNAELQNAIDLFDRGTADLALAEFTKLIDQGHDEAFSFLGNLYEVGGRGVDRDYAKAKFYYEKAVERTGAVAAYLGLIRIYYYGFGVQKDCCKALEYCRILAEEIENPYANLYIGKMYMDGCCTEKNLEASKEYFKKAWNAGYVFGLTYLGLAEQADGHKLRGWLLRLRAGILAFRIARKDSADPRIRMP